MNREPLTCALGISLFLAACGAPPTTTQAQIQHDARCAAGILGGAALGGMVGNRFGGGAGKTLATAAGAGVGMYAGQSVCN
ncbi:glycine zipper 2TM domain-containing protein [Ruegeria sp. AU67]|uniref:glycine zipper 2TM domain-containing protein n=1 Tax=Ruegeria sp. AU67 TaxID=2108530 RepID=UPI000D69B2B9